MNLALEVLMRDCADPGSMTPNDIADARLRLSLGEVEVDS